MRKFKPQSYVLLAILSVVTSLAFFAAALASRYSDFKGSIDRDVQNASVSLQALGFETYNAISTLQAQGRVGCDDASLAFLRGLSFSSLLFTDVAIVSDNAVTCSTTLGQIDATKSLPETAIPISFPDFDTPLIYYSGEESIVDPRVRGSYFRFADYLLSLDDRTLLASEASSTRIAFLVKSNSSFSRLFASQDGQETSVGSDLFSSLKCLERSNLCVLGSQEPSAFAEGLVIPLALSMIMGLMSGGATTVLVERYMAQRSTLKQKLKQAIADGKLFAEYQPIVDMETGTVKGCEALVRWIDDDGQRIRPDIFIAIAEASNFTDEITDYMLRYTAKHVWSRPALKNMRVAINLSPTEALAPDFIARYDAFFAQWGIDKKYVRLEITERVQADLAEFEKALDNICAAGFSMSLDDFGTGHASFPYLRRLKLDAIKIDRSFTISVGEDSAYGRMLPHLIDMIKSLKIAVVVEGIETEKQKDWFLARGSMLAQGYYYSKPLGVDAFEKYVLDHPAPAQMASAAASQATE